MNACQKVCKYSRSSDQNWGILATHHSICVVNGRWPVRLLFQNWLKRSLYASYFTEPPMFLSTGSTSGLILIKLVIKTHKNSTRLRPNFHVATRKRIEDPRRDLCKENLRTSINKKLHELDKELQKSSESPLYQ